MTEEELEARAALNLARSIRRSVGRSRRYMVANRLRYMWVLTRLGGEGLHGVEGRARMMVLVADLVRGLRDELGSEFPYWYSPELHPGGKGESRETCPIPDECGCGGHGWHVNLFVAGRIPHAAMKALWQKVDPGNGYEVRYKDWTRDDRLNGLSFVEKLRAGARYGTKYASKDWSEQVVPAGAHRYEVGEGFQPREVVFGIDDREDLGHALSGFPGGASAVIVWCSLEAEGWDGPLCWLYRWSPP